MGIAAFVLQVYVARGEANLHAEFRLDPSNRLATVHERYRQTGQTDRQRQRSDSIGRTVLQTVAQKYYGQGQFLGYDQAKTLN